MHCPSRAVRAHAKATLLAYPGLVEMLCTDVVHCTPATRGQSLRECASGIFIRHVSAVSSCYKVYIAVEQLGETLAVAHPLPLTMRSV
jgi:hypothetical protein